MIEALRLAMVDHMVAPTLVSSLASWSYSAAGGLAAVVARDSGFRLGRARFFMLLIVFSAVLVVMTATRAASSGLIGSMMIIPAYLITMMTLGLAGWAVTTAAIARRRDGGMARGYDILIALVPAAIPLVMFSRGSARSRPSITVRRKLWGIYGGMLVTVGCLTLAGSISETARNTAADAGLVRSISESQIRSYGPDRFARALSVILTNAGGVVTLEDGRLILTLPAAHLADSASPQWLNDQVGHACDDPAMGALINAGHMVTIKGSGTPASWTVDVSKADCAAA